MKKNIKLGLILCLIIASLAVIGCNEDKEPNQEEIIPIIDKDAFHKIRLTSVLNTVPYTIREEEYMFDSTYGEYTISVYDSKAALVWSLTWRDLSKNDGPFTPTRQVVGNRIFIGVQGVVSVHDLQTGEFLWEVETQSKQANFTLSQDRLYVLSYNENLLSSFDISSGAYIEDWNEDYEDIIGLVVDEGELILYQDYVSEEVDNAYVLDLDFTFLRNTTYKEKSLDPSQWQGAKSSSEEDWSKLIIDGNIKTVWHETIKGYGEKEWFELKRGLPTLVHQLVIYNGNHSSKEAFEENAKLKQASISVGDGKSFIYNFDTYTYGQPTIIEFLRPIVADYIYLEIKSAEGGTLYKNTCVSEVYTQ